MRATTPQMASLDPLFVLDSSPIEGLAVLGASRCSRYSRRWYGASSPVRTAWHQMVINCDNGSRSLEWPIMVM